LNVSGNTFRALRGNIHRGERVDDTYAPMQLGSLKAISFQGNSYHGVETAAKNPLTVAHTQNTHEQVWTVASGGALPFAGRATRVDSVTTTSRPRNASNLSNHAMPYAQALQGSLLDKVQLVWPEAMLGDVSVVMRCD
jgi:hypothetical protein